MSIVEKDTDGQCLPSPFTHRLRSYRSSSLLLLSGVLALSISLCQNLHMLQHVIAQAAASQRMHALADSFFLPSPLSDSSFTVTADRVSRLTSARAVVNASRRQELDMSSFSQSSLPDLEYFLRNPQEAVFQTKCTLLNGTQVVLSPVDGKDGIRIPTFIIVGVHKGGTTALRELLQVHQQRGSLARQKNRSNVNFVPSIKREPHYFDWHYDAIIKTLFGGGSCDGSHETVDGNCQQTNNRERYQRGLCQVRYEYMTQHFDMRMFAAAASAEAPTSSVHYYSYEKTPSYIIKPGVASLIKQVLPWTKIIVSLRNPIDRCISHYRMDIERQYYNKTFEGWLANDLRILHERNYTLPPVATMPASLRQAWKKIRRRPVFNRTNSRVDWRQTSLLYRGFYAEQLREWLKYYTLGEDMYILPFERLKQHPKEVLQDMLDFLGISSSTSQSWESANNSTGKSEQQEDHAYHQSYSPNKGELNITIENDLREYLKRLWKPYNDDLANLLSSSLLPYQGALRGTSQDGWKDTSHERRISLLRDLTRLWE